MSAFGPKPISLSDPFQQAGLREYDARSKRWGVNETT